MDSILLSLGPFVFHRLEFSLIFMQMFLSVLVNHIINFLLLSFDILESVEIILEHVFMISSNISFQHLSPWVEFHSVFFFFLFQAPISLSHSVHFVYLLFVHIFNEWLPFLHDSNSGWSSCLFFFQLYDSGFDLNLFIVCLF